MEIHGFDATVTSTTDGTTAESSGANLVTGSGAVGKDQRQKKGRKNGVITWLTDWVIEALLTSWFGAIYSQH